jgi:two-component system, NtrC family, C4-dicarboxylate transport sensor histidine kinase DctB
MSDIEKLKARFEIEKWKSKFESEHKLREHAEELLETRSAELCELNETLVRRIEEEVEKNREKELILFQQSKMASMGEMIGNIAHQWRQPLSAISSIASAHIVQNEVGMLSVEGSRESLTDIMRHTEFLSNTIDDFRNFFRNDKEYTIFLVEESVATCLHILAGIIATNSITIVKDIEHIQLFSLKNEFVQVILNLVKNAIDALMDVFDDDEKFIFIKAYVENEEAHIVITDTAGGIPKSIMNRIFEPYFTTKHQSQGTGIGLFMSSEIIGKHMKGTIGVENVDTEVEGTTLRGASFKISIPLEY